MMADHLADNLVVQMVRMLVVLKAGMMAVSLVGC